jgi:hypothetical protein
MCIEKKGIISVFDPLKIPFTFEKDHENKSV